MENFRKNPIPIVEFDSCNIRLLLEGAGPKFGMPHRSLLKKQFVSDVQRIQKRIEVFCREQIKESGSENANSKWQDKQA